MRNLQKTGLTLLAAVAWLSAEAYDFKENGLYYNIVDMGSKTCAVTQGTESYSGEVSVPEEANGYKVVGVGDRNFSIPFHSFTGSEPPVSSISDR